MEETSLQSASIKVEYCCIDSWLSVLPDDWAIENHDSGVNIPPHDDSLVLSAQLSQRRPLVRDDDNRMDGPDQDTASTGSAPGSVLSLSTRLSQTVFSARPILKPKPPSALRSRSSSPTRTVLATLERAAPPIKICKPNKEAVQQEPVVVLRKFLTEGYDRAIIPRGLEPRLREIDPDEIDGMHDSLFDDEREYTNEALDALWEQVRGVYEEADACHNLHKDENAWVEVARSVLRMAGLHSISTDLEVNSVQSQSIDPQYLPSLPNHTAPISKKADLALVYPPNPLQTSWLNDNPGSTLSHLSDAYTSHLPVACALEIKKLGGDYEEAVCQLGIWSAAALEKIRTLRADRQLREPFVLLPFLGWTLVGYEWTLHIAWKDDTKAVTLFGPYGLLTASTSSWIGIFRLRRLVQVVKKWLLDIYWPWLCSEVLGIN